MDIEDMSPEWLFRVCDRMHHYMLTQELERRNLSQASHPFLLFVLDDAGSSISQRELSRKLGISPPTIAVSIQRMERAGLLRKDPDSQDARRNRVTMTAKGARLVQECHVAFDEIDRGMFRGFEPGELETLRRFYIRIIRNLEAMGAQSPGR